ncbi:MAG: VWA domain-containing protein [Candidatus Acidiferrales bacterium]
MRRLIPIAAVALLALVVPGMLGQNSPSPSEDEFRWGARPYVPQPPNAIRVKTSIVQVPVVVRDSNGKALPGLKKSDFELYDNGHPVEIASFAVENQPAEPLRASQPVPVVNTNLATAAPPPPVNPPAPTARYIALFFDDTSMRMFDVVMARNAATSFVKTSLKPGDKIGIFTTSTDVSLDFTDNVPKLVDTIGKIISQRKNAGGMGASCEWMNPYQASLIVQTYDVHSDALDLAGAEGCGDVHMIISAAQNMLGQSEQYAQETLGVITDVLHYLGRMPGHRMMVLASSGFLTQTLRDKQDKVIDTALNANVIINSLDAKGLVADVLARDDEGRPVPIPPQASRMIALFDEFKSDNREYENDVMAILAQGTGGKFYHNRNDLDVGLREMATTPDVSYLLTFSPVNLKANGSSHSIKVKLPNTHGLKIEARRGYMAPSPIPSDAEKKQRKLDKAVLADDNPAALSAQVSTAPGISADGNPILKITIHVDVSKLPYQTQGDRKVERLIFITALFDNQNHFLSGVQGVMDLRLKKDTLSTISSTGLDAKLSMQAPPGNYRLRQVVEEVGDGRMAAMNRNIQIQ